MAQIVNLSSNAVATRSDFRVIKFNYKWEVPLSYTKGASINYSPLFSTPGYECCKWMIRAEQDLPTLSLYLHAGNENPDVSAHCKFSTTDYFYRETNATNEEELAVNFKANEWSGFDAFKQRIYGSKKVEITCEIVVLPDFYDTVKNKVLQKAECNLNENLGNLFGNDKFSDVKLVVGDYELPAHKYILAVRSNVFAAMFEHDMEERKSSRVDIEDVKPEVLREMLRFMYTAKAPELSEMAADLLVAADKYALQDLKDMCAKSLCSQLSSETAVQTLILADIHGADELKSTAMTFICNNAGKIMNTETWKDAIVEHPRLIAMELSAALTSSKLKVEK